MKTKSKSIEKVERVTKGNQIFWPLIWPEIDQVVDPVQCAADFYLLEGLSSGVFNTVKAHLPNSVTTNNFLEVFDFLSEEERKELLNFPLDKEVELLENLENTASNLLRDLVEWLDPILINYMQLAIGGELRHNNKLKAETLSPNRSMAWVDWRHIFDEIGTDALVQAQKFFLQLSGSYGGNAWATIAKVLYDRLENKLGPDDYTNKKMFIDRAWTLQHNCGSMLNKIEWSVINRLEMTVGEIANVLDAHSQNPPNMSQLFLASSRPVIDLFDEYYKTLNILEEKFNVTPSINYASLSLQEFRCCNACGSNIDLGHYGSCWNVTTGIVQEQYDPEVLPHWASIKYTTSPDSSLLKFDCYGKPSPMATTSIGINIFGLVGHQTINLIDFLPYREAKKTKIKIDEVIQSKYNVELANDNQFDLAIQIVANNITLTKHVITDVETPLNLLDRIK